MPVKDSTNVLAISVLENTKIDQYEAGKGNKDESE